MKKIIDKRILNLIRESNEFGIDDRLSSLVKESEELSEDELELVFAAKKPDYEKFKSLIKDK